MLPFLKLIRYKNLLMVLLTMVLTKYALIESFVERSYLSNFQFSILALSIILITAGGYIVNDVFDIESDKINKPKKVFVGEFISVNRAWKLYLLISFIGLLLGTYLSFILGYKHYSFIFVITIISLFFYSKFLKHKILIGNLLVSILVSLVIYTLYLFDFKIIPEYLLTFEEHTSSTLFLNVWFAIIIYMFFSFFTTLIREIIKDLEDINGDFAQNSKTLPIVLGRKRTISLIKFVFVVFFFLQILLFNFKVDKYSFFAYIFSSTILPLLYFIYKLWNAESKKDYSKLSQLMKIIMLFGILSMLFFKFM